MLLKLLCSEQFQKLLRAVLLGDDPGTTAT